MIQDFTYKQTQMPPDKYNSKILIGNWYEERCDPDSKNSNFFVQNKFEQEKVYEKGILSAENFQNSTGDILAFQPTLTKETVYTTIHMQEFKKPEESKRTSVLLPHLTKKSYFDKHPEELEEYRKKWTTAQHAWDRTYPGKEPENVMIKK